MGKFTLRLLNSLFVTLFCFSAYAEKGVFVYDDFSKGLNTKHSDIGLDKRQATIAENIRFNKTLKGISKREQLMKYGIADDSEAITGLHRFYTKDGDKYLLATHGDEVEVGDDDAGTFSNLLTFSTGNHRWEWQTWHDIAIGTDGYNQPVKTDGTVITYLGSCGAADAGSGSGPDGAYTYKVTFYTTSYEVSFDQVSNTITVSDNDIDLTMIPIGPDTFGGEDVLGRNIYRTSAGGSDYKLLTNGQIANNTATTLTDSDADAARGDALSPDYTYQPPKGKFILINNNRLFLANNPDYPSRIYYSESGSHDIFYTSSYFNIRENDGDAITFVKNFLGILTIGKNNSIQKLYTDGDDPSADWEISDPYPAIGCQAPYSACVTPTGIFYLAFDGIYRFTGQYSELISDAVTPVIGDIASSNLVNCVATFYRNCYYLSYTSNESGETYNNRVLVFDLLSNAYSIDKISVNAFCSFNSGTDWGILYSGSSEDGTVSAHQSFSYEVIHKSSDDFAGTWDDARLIPTRWGGLENDPIMEIARIETVDSLAVTVDALVGVVDREDTDGWYISQVLEVGASSFDKLYWNEIIPASGGDVSMRIRSGATTSDCIAATWSSDYDDPTGSDISGETANDYIQYMITMDTLNIVYTPTVVKEDGYLVKILYNREGTVAETSIPLHYAGGWLDFGQPGYIKSLEKIYIFYESAGEGTLELKFDSLQGDSDTFSINLADYPSRYVEYFSNGAMTGEFFKIDIQENSLNDITIKKIIIVYDLEPLV